MGEADVDTGIFCKYPQDVFLDIVLDKYEYSLIYYARHLCSADDHRSSITGYVQVFWPDGETSDDGPINTYPRYHYMQSDEDYIYELVQSAITKVRMAHDDGTDRFCEATRLDVLFCCPVSNTLV